MKNKKLIGEFRRHLMDIVIIIMDIRSFFGNSGAQSDEDQKPDRKRLKKPGNTFGYLIMTKIREIKEREECVLDHTIECVLDLQLNALKSIFDINCLANIVVFLIKKTHIDTDTDTEYREDAVKISLEVRAKMVNDQKSKLYKYYQKNIYSHVYVEAIDQAFASLVSSIKELGYDTMTCSFIEKSQIKGLRFAHSLLGEVPSIKMADEVCSVCFEFTFSKTACNHSLCVPCADKISSTSEDQVCCPICRQEGIFHIHFG